MAEKTIRRPAISGGFRVCVIPNDDIPKPSSLTTPPMLGGMREVASVNARGDVGACFWAFKSKAERLKIAKNLRALAAFIEE